MAMAQHGDQGERALGGLEPATRRHIERLATEAGFTAPTVSSFSLLELSPQTIRPQNGSNTRVGRPNG